MGKEKAKAKERFLPGCRFFLKGKAKEKGGIQKARAKERTKESFPCKNLCCQKTDWPPTRGANLLPREKGKLQPKEKLKERKEMAKAFGLAAREEGGSKENQCCLPSFSTVLVFGPTNAIAGVHNFTEVWQRRGKSLCL